MEERQYNEDFDFVLLLNNNIIVKRNFNINGYNPDIIKSNNFKGCVDGVVNIIKDDLRKKSIKFMLEHIDKFYETPNFETTDSVDVIRLQILYKGEPIANRMWDATIYPATIRHTVNIRKYIYEIITKVQRTLSSRYYNTNYLGYDLARN